MRLAIQVLTAVLTLSSSAAFAQEPSPRWSVEMAGGAHLNAAGGHGSASVGFAPAPRFKVLVSVERIYLPREGRTNPPRGATTTFGELEARVRLFEADRLSPYALVMYGRGVSSGKEHAISPEYATDDRFMFLIGAGVRVPIGRRLEAFGDVRAGPKIGPYDVLAPMVPIRVGIAWRF